MSELGNKLKEAREKSQLSLEDLQKITKIQKRYLIGIEDGNYESMPGQFYVRAFIKQYAEAVGLDPDELFEEYESEIPNKKNEEIPSQLSRVRKKKQISTNGSKILDLIPMLLLILFLVGGAVSLWYFLQQADLASDSKEQVEDSTPPEIEQSENSPLTEVEENKDTEETNEAPNEEPNEDVMEEEATNQQIEVVETNDRSSTVALLNAETFELTVSSSGQTWVEIYNGKGKNLFRGMINEGDDPTVHDLTGESEIRLVAGNAADTIVKINGEDFIFPIDPKEKPGRQETKILTNQQ